MARYRKRAIKINLKKESVQSVSGVVLILLAVLIALSFFGQAGGLGNPLQTILNRLFGWGVVLVPFVLASFGLTLLRLKLPFTNLRVSLGLLLFTLSFLGFVHLFFPPYDSYYQASHLGQGGGLTGYYLQLILRKLFSWVGAFLILGAGLITSVLVTLNLSFDEALFYVSKGSTFLGGLIQNYLWRGRKFKEKGTPLRQDFAGQAEETKVGEGGGLIQQPIDLGRPFSEPIYRETAEGKKTVQWQYPPLDLLNEPPGEDAVRGDIDKQKEVIEQALSSFDIKARVVEVNLGPAVTQYALETSEGTRIANVVSLQSDLALALASPTGTIRIEAPIPGRSLVGIEVPNIKPSVVTVKELLSSDRMQTHPSKLAVGLGKDVSGSLVIDELNRMPHVLIAGSTGSGKSILLRAFLVSLLYRNSPEELKLVLIDPKRVEFSLYEGIPHLLAPVIFDPEKTLPTLKWLLSEMGERYKVLQNAGARDIGDYNKMHPAHKLPFIAMFVDELADIMVLAPGEVEKGITRLAQMSRATGIHLVLATQRPSTDILTGLIKANIPCRIAFNVTSQVDSRVIMDQPGAEKLLGKGDMLYVPPDAAKPKRIQGPFVSNEELKKVLDFVKGQGILPSYRLDLEEEGRQDEEEFEGEDPLFSEAVEVITEYERASASLLQRRLKIGYARAARLLDEMEAQEIVGPADGAKPREVLKRKQTGV